MYYILACIIAILIFSTIVIYNTLLSKKNKMLKAYSSLDVMLKKRYDLIPNIVETVKGYKNYEAETLTKIIGLRSLADECKNAKELNAVSGQYNNFMSEINMLSEQYPDLKAGENFIHLQKVLNEVEEQISAARRTYNAHVENFNTYIGFFPINLFAAMFRYKPADFFEATEEEKNNIKVEV